jgi:hypothetical protein
VANQGRIGTLLGHPNRSGFQWFLRLPQPTADRPRASGPAAIGELLQPGLELEFSKMGRFRFPELQRLWAQDGTASLVSFGGALAMLRVALVVLAILVGYDHYKYNGRFLTAATQASTSILQHFQVL